MEKAQTSLLEKFKPLFTDRQMLIVFLLGIWSGTPLLLTAGTLQAWCKQEGMSLTNLGLLSILGTPYAIKVLWAPILDWYIPPFLGRRRGWLILSQVGLIASLIGLALTGPSMSMILFLSWAVLIAFFSATQDIAIDAYQIEILPHEQYGLGNQLYVLGYRIGMIIASSGALILSDFTSWTNVYLIMALFMSLALVTTLFAQEPRVHAAAPKAFSDAVWHPIRDFFSSSGSFSGKALWVLGFFLLYKIGADLATAITTPFYMELGYSNFEIGAVAKSFGLMATIVGGLIGGVFVVGLGLKRCLWIFGILQAVGFMAFSWLAEAVRVSQVADPGSLALAISIENFAAGLATAAYTTYMGTVVNRSFTATQYALLSSLMAMARVYGGAPSGYLAELTGWTGFFVLCSLASVPGLFILWKLQKIERAEAKWSTNDDHGRSTPVPVSPS